jgi:hypothetical protein
MNSACCFRSPHKSFQSECETPEQGLEETVIAEQPRASSMPQDYGDGNKGHNYENDDQLRKKTVQSCDGDVYNQATGRLTEPATKTNSQEDIGQILSTGQLLQDSGTKLRYKFYRHHFQISESPVVGWYSPWQSVKSQTSLACKLLDNQAMGINVEELQTGVTFKALKVALPQVGSKQVFVFGTGWPDITGGNCLMPPDTQDIDVLMLVQLFVIISVCDCVIITVKDINRHQLQLLVKILDIAKQNCTTAILIHDVQTEERFKNQYKLIEEYLPMPDIRDDGHDTSNSAKKNTISPEQVLRDKQCSFPSDKLKLFHYSSKNEKAISRVRRYIRDCQFLDSLSRRHHTNTIYELFSQTVDEFIQLTNLTRVLDIRRNTISGENSECELTITIRQ